MYGWIWRHLPGGTASRLVCCLLLAAAAVALLLLVVFPWAEPRLPFGEVTVEEHPRPQGAPSAGALPVPSPRRL